MIKHYHPENYYLTDQLKILFPKIRAEYKRWQKFLIPVHYRNWVWKNIDLEKTGCWHLLPLMRHYQVIKWKRFFFPVTHDLIYRLPIYENLMFSRFAPRTEIHAHKGWSNHFVRVHLGIETNDRCDLVLEDRIVPEREGQVIMFDDSQTHRAYNHGDTERVILIFDMLRDDLEKYRK